MGKDYCFPAHTLSLFLACALLLVVIFSSLPCIMSGVFFWLLRFGFIKWADELSLDFAYVTLSPFRDIGLEWKVEGVRRRKGRGEVVNTRVDIAGGINDYCFVRR